VAVSLFALASRMRIFNLPDVQSALQFTRNQPGHLVTSMNFVRHALYAVLGIVAQRVVATSHVTRYLVAIRIISVAV
jgi:hypothetical protein